MNNDLRLNLPQGLDSYSYSSSPPLNITNRETFNHNNNLNFEEYIAKIINKEDDVKENSNKRGKLLRDYYPLEHSDITPLNYPKRKNREKRMSIEKKSKFKFWKHKLTRVKSDQEKGEKPLSTQKSLPLDLPIRDADIDYSSSSSDDDSEDLFVFLFHFLSLSTLITKPK